MAALLYMIDATRYVPCIPIPGKISMTDNMVEILIPMHQTMGQTFCFLCSLWAIVSEVIFIYRTSEGLGTENLPPAFALSRYHRLLSLADDLPNDMIRSESSGSHVLTFQ
jgi:hypothetical protein